MDRPAARQRRYASVAYAPNFPHGDACSMSRTYMSEWRTTRRRAILATSAAFGGRDGNDGIPLHPLVRRAAQQGRSAFRAARRKLEDYERKRAP